VFLQNYLTVRRCRLQSCVLAPFLITILTGYFVYYYLRLTPSESLCSGEHGYVCFVLFHRGFAEFFERIKLLVLPIYCGH